MTGTVTVAAGATLTIEPGVALSFASSAYLNINGTLDAQGSTGMEIRFQRQDGQGAWGGISFGSAAPAAVFSAIRR